MLLTPSWRYGLFTHLPLGRFAELAGGPVAPGVLNLLPLLLLGLWFLSRRTAARPQTWRWGHPAVVWPLLAITLLTLLRLDWTQFRFVFVQLGGLCFIWFTLLFVVNERPALPLVVAPVLLIQGPVALAQFFLQREVGLAWFGELVVRPELEGVTVLFAQQRPWLRAYGLTAHPNWLGALLAILLLLLLADPSVRRLSWLRALALVTGLLGLLVSFSRAAWLGFGVGAALWFWGQRPARGQRLWLLLPLILPLLLILVYRDLALSRFLALDTPIEAQSINQRLSDAALALQLFAQRPWLGVGTGRFVDAARLLDPAAARVHNVVLLAMAEWGVLGATAVVWQWIAPFWAARRQFRTLAPALAPWLAMIVIALFDTTVWPGGHWQTAVLFGLLAGTLSSALQARLSERS